MLTGLWTETCIALPTVQMIHDGYEIYVAEDCCGDVSQFAHDNAMRRVIQAGAKPVTALSIDARVAARLGAARHLRRRHGRGEVHLGAYGIGVEYAYTMVHGAQPTVVPAYEVPQPALAHK